MNPEDQNNPPQQPSQKKVIQPINPTELKAFVEENRTPPQATVAPTETSLQPSNPQIDPTTNLTSSSPGTPPTWDEPKKTVNFKKYFKYVALGVVVLVIAFVVYSIKYANTYTKINVTGPDFTYSVDFDRNGKSAINGKNSLLQGTSLHSLTKVLVTVGPAPNASSDCHAGAGSSITVISNDLVNGEQHNLCYGSLENTYEANFHHNGSWFYVSVKPYSGTSKINLETVNTIIDSINVN